MKNVVTTLLALVAVTAGAADTQYLIDGFTVIVGDDIVIDGNDAMADTLVFRAEGRPDPLARAVLVYHDPTLSDGEAALVTLFRLMRPPSSTLPIESLGVRFIPETPGDGGWGVAITFGGVRWDAFVIRLPPTPGGLVRSLVFIPRLSGDAGRGELQQVFKGLEIRIESAAG